MRPSRTMTAPTGTSPLFISLRRLPQGLAHEIIVAVQVNDGIAHKCQGSKPRVNMERFGRRAVFSLIFNVERSRMFLLQFRVPPASIRSARPRGNGSARRKSRRETARTTARFFRGRSAGFSNQKSFAREKFKAAFGVRRRQRFQFHLHLEQKHQPVCLALIAVFADEPGQMQIRRRSSTRFPRAPRGTRRRRAIRRGPS
jgi:hypothetical protein